MMNHSIRLRRPPMRCLLHFRCSSKYNPSVVESFVLDKRKLDDFCPRIKLANEFEFDLNKDCSFRMCLPPPNVTGNLHIGHALTISIEDCLIRWNKLNGKQVSLIVGFDHAGIGTQLVVEKRLQTSKGILRKNMTKEEFIEECQSWKADRMKHILHQLSHLGANSDLNQSYYTLDKNFSGACIEAFLTLYRRGLITRNKRVIHWCPYLQTSISDKEVLMKHVTPNTSVTIPGHSKPVLMGIMYYIQYQLEDKSGSITVGTTRPETILVDSALAVNKNDVRYSSLIGKRVMHPIFPDKSIPIIEDDSVDINIGTGVLKVTPAHDFQDWDIFNRHQFLPTPSSCISETGIISPGFGQYSGLDRFEARELILSCLGSRVQSRDHIGSIPVCSRSGDIIEPMLKDQWFIDCKQMATNCIEAVKSGQLRLVPSLFEQHWNTWMNNSESWCISRQLWWGHNIPAYYCNGKHTVAQNKNDAVEYFQQTLDADVCWSDVDVDVDVLDTWFSSSLIPIITGGWPMNPNPAPLSLMETGHDILGFWVARMVMLCTELTGVLPFKNVLLHGLVRDGKGDKMSKSKGNAIDPMHLIHGATLKELQTSLQDSSGLTTLELEESLQNLSLNLPSGLTACGSDALRFSLLRHDVQQMHIDIDLVAEATTAQHFCNKIWNGVRYFLILREKMNDFGIKSGDEFVLSTVDLWLQSRLHSTSCKVAKSLENYQFHLATNYLYEFWWNDLCDVYLEIAKISTNEGKIDSLQSICYTLDTCISKFLCLLHPFMPFLTEYLILHSNFQDFKSGKALDFNNLNSDLSLELNMIRSLKVVKTCRAIKNEFRIPQKELLKGFVSTEDSSKYDILETIITPLCGLEVDSHLKPSPNLTQYLISGNVSLFVQLPQSNKSYRIESLKQNLEKKVVKRDQMEKKVKVWQVAREKESQRRSEKRLRHLNHGTRAMENLNVEIKSIEKMIKSLQN